jgi:Tat protein translocase TatB subunit
MGPGELLLIAMVGLIVFGPGKLPEIASQVGRAVRDLRRSTSEMTQEFREAMQPLDEMRQFPNEIKGAVGAAAVMAQQGVAGHEGSPPAAGPAPATADTSEWHWEGAEGAAASAPAATPSGDGFWDWSAPESAPTPPPPPASPEAPPAIEATAAAPEPAPAANGSIWQWDEADTVPTAPAASGPTAAEATVPPAPINGASPEGTAGPVKAEPPSPTPVPDVALVGEPAADAAASLPTRPAKAAPTEDSA